MKRILLGVAAVLAALFFIAGCSPGPGGKAPVDIRGVVANPENACYLDFDPNPVILEGLPLPNAKVTIIGDQGSLITTTTDSQGAFLFRGYSGEAYVLYAEKDSIRVKRGITTVVASQDVGEANYFTTAQVIVWEVANELYPGVIAIKDIPGINPGDELPEAVKAVLANCGDAQGDPGVRALAESLVNVLFGAPGEGTDIPGGDEPAGTPTPTPISTPEVTPTPTPTSPPTPSPGCATCPPPPSFPPPPPPPFPR
ncbi:MAG: carboxypeptidase regulatory-like domain-containing protein [Candidatus Caldatribacterium sp.]|nr:carboxypeptidase regulatory-like domain-containing protein [Candidatus Caldatribacterium sp.]